MSPAMGYGFQGQGHDKLTTNGINRLPFILSLSKDLFRASLVPFPFTDQSTTKKRPAIIVSSQHYKQNGLI